MTLVAYAVLFVLVAIMGAGLPGPGDASLIAAGARAGEGRLDIWIVLAAAMVAWMLGSMAGYAVGATRLRERRAPRKMDLARLREVRAGGPAQPRLPGREP